MDLTALPRSPRLTLDLCGGQAWRSRASSARGTRAPLYRLTSPRYAPASTPITAAMRSSRAHRTLSAWHSDVIFLGSRSSSVPVSLCLSLCTSPSLVLSAFSLPSSSLTHMCRSQGELWKDKASLIRGVGMPGKLTANCA